MGEPSALEFEGRLSVTSEVALLGIGMRLDHLRAECQLVTTSQRSCPPEVERGAKELFSSQLCKGPLET